jgi:glycosyltransferase involved in cell wall biosynthesis
MRLNIAIIGTRGIPNQYGGFEQLAEYLSIGLIKKGHAVSVYSSHKHPFQEKELKGVEIIHCYDPECHIGTAGQFIYDLNCVRDARKRNFDVLLFLGYSSSSIWGRLYPKNQIILSNMDGLEWKRAKYSKPVRWFLKYAEKFAIKYSDYFIADSVAIQSYLEKKYETVSEYIPYGAKIYAGINEKILSKYNVSEQDYFMLMARMEPENNIEMILDGFHKTNTTKKFLVIGSTNNRFGKYIFRKFSKDKRIQFLGALYDAQLTHTLKASSMLYFHGHSVGGTNPSLLEAMASGALIAAHENAFNKAVLGNDAYYFKTGDDVQQLIKTVTKNSTDKKMICNNLKKINDEYNWQNIIDRYENFIIGCYNKKHK